MSDFDLSSFIGSEFEMIEKLDYTWLFRFSKRQVITTESVWRLVSVFGVIASSLDHNEKFGLPSPIDATKKVQDAIGNRCVICAEILKPSGDLTIEFDGESRLHFPTFSSGYESWSLSISATESIICQGGGTVVRVAT